MLCRCHRCWWSLRLSLDCGGIGCCAACRPSLGLCMFVLNFAIDRSPTRPLRSFSTPTVCRRRRVGGLATRPVGSHRYALTPQTPGSLWTSRPHNAQRWRHGTRTASSCEGAVPPPTAHRHRQGRVSVRPLEFKRRRPLLHCRRPRRWLCSAKVASFARRRASRLRFIG